MQVSDGGKVVCLREKEVEGLHFMLLQLRDEESLRYQEAWFTYVRYKNIKVELLFMLTIMYLLTYILLILKL